MGVILSPAQRALAERLRAKGFTKAEIARQLSIKGLVSFRPLLRHSQTDWKPGPRRLVIEEREEILIGLRQGESMSSIARRLKRAPSTITREVRANGGPSGYGVWRGQTRAKEWARRPKTPKLCHPPLVAQVSTWLEELWSPDEISKRLRREFRDDPMMQVSHETIYQSLFVQGRGELRRELARCLRSGRAKRRTRTQGEARGKIAHMVMISERPAEVADRAVPGHWEGDLILGAMNRSAVGTLVERSTRFVLLLYLAPNHGAEAVEAAMRQAVRTLPEVLCKSITWDSHNDLVPWARVGSDPTWDRLCALPWIRRSGSCPGTRTSRSDERDLIGALASTVRVLSAVPAGGAIPLVERRRQVPVCKVMNGLSSAGWTPTKTSTSR